MEHAANFPTTKAARESSLCGLSTAPADSQDQRRNWRKIGVVIFFAGRISTDSRKDGEKGDVPSFDVRFKPHRRLLNLTKVASAAL